MAITSPSSVIIITLGLCTLTTAAVLKQVSSEANVTEGMMANFTCLIKNKNAGIIRWRIGHFSEACNGHSIDGTGMDIVCTTTVDGRKLTETIGVMATVELHGTPVQCMLASFVCKKDECDEYSNFTLLRVSRTAPAVNETEDTQESESSGSAEASRDHRSVFSSEVSLDSGSGEESASHDLSPASSAGENAAVAAVSVSLLSLLATLTG